MKIGPSSTGTRTTQTGLVRGEVPSQARSSRIHGAWCAWLIMPVHVEYIRVVSVSGVAAASSSPFEYMPALRTARNSQHLRFEYFFFQRDSRSRRSQGVLISETEEFGLFRAEHVISEATGCFTSGCDHRTPANTQFDCESRWVAAPRSPMLEPREVIQTQLEMRGSENNTHLSLPYLGGFGICGSPEKQASLHRCQVVPETCGPGRRACDLSAPRAARCCFRELPVR
jgi:hypothetical protein